jgi:aminopeptidase N
MAIWFAERGYPRNVITPEAIAAADDYISRADLPAPLRRLLTEGRDDAARALRCQQRDAAAG